MNPNEGLNYLRHAREYAVERRDQARELRDHEAQAYWAALLDTLEPCIELAVAEARGWDRLVVDVRSLD